MSEHANTSGEGDAADAADAAGAEENVAELLARADSQLAVDRVASFVAGLYDDTEKFSPSHRLVARDVSARIRREFLKS